MRSCGVSGTLVQDGLAQMRDARWRAVTSNFGFWYANVESFDICDASKAWIRCGSGNWVSEHSTGKCLVRFFRITCWSLLFSSLLPLLLFIFNIPQRHWVQFVVPRSFIFRNRGQVSFSSCHGFCCLYLCPPGFCSWLNSWGCTLSGPNAGPSRGGHVMAIPKPQPISVTGPGRRQWSLDREGDDRGGSHWGGEVARDGPKKFYGWLTTLF